MIKITSFYIMGLLGFVLLSGATFGQFRQISPVTPYDLTCVHFADANHGFAGGLMGTIIRTTDGGDSWDALPVVSKTTVNAIHFLTPDTGFVVGESGLFLKTFDGGTTWHILPASSTIDFTGIDFVNKQTGFVIGHSPEGGLFYKTTDSGLNWSIKTIKDDCSERDFVTGFECDDIYLMNMSFLDENNGIIGGFAYNFNYGKRPFVSKTEDGGQTFTDISPRFKQSEWFSGKEIVAVDYLNDHDAIAIMNTGDGTDFLLISDYRIKTFRSSEMDNEFNSRGLYFNVQFLGRFIGYFTGIIDGHSQIIKTIDQGNSFMFLNPPTDKSLYAAAFTDVNTGFFVGQDGTILQFKDKTNIVYHYPEARSGYFADPPYTMASTKKSMTSTQIHVYNVDANNEDLFEVIMRDRHGNEIPVKRFKTKIYSDEVRMKVKTAELSSGTYFYTVIYKNQTLVNGKIDRTNFVKN
ncbi:MAG: hypothetical protein KQI35_18510 [Bacteroidetes bacterium]|nr:hypothetical protein [Bacteroidota bacterium]